MQKNSKSCSNLITIIAYDGIFEKACLIGAISRYFEADYITILKPIANSQLLFLVSTIVCNINIDVEWCSIRKGRELKEALIKPPMDGAASLILI